jgi:hypothetical protein
MWENRISGYFDASENAVPPPAPQANVSGGCPHLIQRNDIYRAAHARAVFEYQLGQLFNSGASDE